MDGAGYIEFGDFGATLSTFARSVEEDVLYLLFQIFDHDNDGYLMREDVARILLAHNMIEASVLKKNNDKIYVLSREETLKLAEKMLQQVDSNGFQDNKISFDEFNDMMYHRNKFTLDKKPSVLDVDK